MTHADIFLGTVNAITVAMLYLEVSLRIHKRAAVCLENISVAVRQLSQKEYQGAGIAFNLEHKIFI